MSTAAEALRRAIAAVNDARSRVSDLQQFDIEDSVGEAVEIDRLVDGLDEIHSELDDAIYAIENAEEEDDLDDDVDERDGDEDEFDDEDDDEWPYGAE